MKTQPVERALAHADEIGSEVGEPSETEDAIITLARAVRELQELAPNAHESAGTNLDRAFETFLAQPRDHLNARQQLWTAFKAGGDWSITEMRTVLAEAQS